MTRLTSWTQSFVFVVIYVQQCLRCDAENRSLITDMVERPQKNGSVVSRCENTVICDDSPMCWCHPLCRVYGNCCEKYTTWPQHPLPKLASCVALFRSQYFVDVCSDNSPCINYYNRSVPQSETDLPVASKHTGLHYQTLACGLCNGEQPRDLVNCAWSSKKCRRQLNDSEAMRLDIASEICSIDVRCDVGLTPYCIPGAISNCAKNECQKEIAYVSVESEGHKVFKNKICAECNQVFDYQTNSKCDIKRKETSVARSDTTCKGYKFMDICHPIVCGLAYKRANNSCILRRLYYLLLCKDCQNLVRDVGNLNSLGMNIKLGPIFLAKSYVIRLFEVLYVKYVHKLLIHLERGNKVKVRILHSKNLDQVRRAPSKWFNENHENVGCVQTRTRLTSLLFKEKSIVRPPKTRFLNKLYIRHVWDDSTINTTPDEIRAGSVSKGVSTYEIVTETCPIDRGCDSIYLSFQVRKHLEPELRNSRTICVDVINAKRRQLEDALNREITQKHHGLSQNTSYRATKFGQSNNTVKTLATLTTNTETSTTTPVTFKGAQSPKPEQYDNYKEFIFDEKPFGYMKHRTNEKLISKGNRSEEIITIIGLCFSLLSLFATGGVYIYGGHVKNTPGKIVFSFCASLFTAQFFFIFLDYEFNNFVYCKALAVIDHFFWLSSFSWSSVMLLDLVRVIVNAETPSILRGKFNNYLFYSSLAWCLPIAIVTTLVCLDEFDVSQHVQYGTQGFCWLHYSYAQIFGFGVPIAACIVINILLLSRIFMAFYQLRMNTRTLGTSATLSHRRSAIISLKLVSVMGLTWVFGFAGAITQYDALMYMFSMINSFQGVYVFLGFAYDHKKVSSWCRASCTEGVDRNDDVTGQTSITATDNHGPKIDTTKI